MDYGLWIQIYGFIFCYLHNLKEGQNITEMQTGYHKLSRAEKVAQLALDPETEAILQASIHQNEALAAIVDELSENTIAHFPFPLGIAPHVKINQQDYFLPLVTEESSVVAAIAKAAKFWYPLGGIKTTLLGDEKKGAVHFFWKGSAQQLLEAFPGLEKQLYADTAQLTQNMRERGGGIREIRLVNKSADLAHYFKLDVAFATGDAMGANFINSCLEQMAQSLKRFVASHATLDANLLEVNMAILSNYTPNNRVLAQVSCPLLTMDAYGEQLGIDQYSHKFIQAVEIARIDSERAVTHNKGIFNGIDALALATGNDWRAIEACGHAYAAAEGHYRSLSRAYVQEDCFYFELELPFAVGTVGGVTNLHPLAKAAMAILKYPNAATLMQLMAASGLAANFSAILALTSTGIQKGHMKMHLNNILSQLGANAQEKQKALNFFADKTVSYAAVKQFLKS